MVVIAIAITSKVGKPLVSRQFRPLPKSRIDSLLTSFPKLIPLGSQHTTVETSDVRYVYQPFDESYVVVVTNRGSNILQDISTLSLIVRLVTSLTPSMSEPAILANSFELLCAFDEVVSLGYKENVSLQQIRNVLEGESHEEKIQDIIARNKEAEAKEELKRRAKQLELQRREQQRNNPGFNISRANQNAGFQTGVGPSGNSMGGFPSVPRQEHHTTERDFRPHSSATSVKPSFTGSGMKLGKKVKQSELLDAMGGEVSVAAVIDASQKTSVPPHSAGESVVEELEVSMRKGVDVTIQETINARISRHGDLESFEIRGDMDLRINEPAFGKLALRLADVPPLYTSGDTPLQFQQHPNVKKFTAASADKTISLKDPARTFPVGQGLGVLRWKFASKDETVKPLNVTCWPSENSDGTMSVSLEYDLAATHLVLEDVVLRVPVEQTPQGISLTTGKWSIEDGHFVWALAKIDLEQPAGNLEFTCESSGPDSFFPIKVDFHCAESICGIQILEIQSADDIEDIPVTKRVRAASGLYSVV